jgi:hypothetical protein
MPSRSENNYEKELMKKKGKEATVSYFRILHWNLLGMTEI